MKVCDVTNFYSARSGGVKTYIGYKRAFIEAAQGKHEHVLIVPGERDGFTSDGQCRTYRIFGPRPFWEKNYRFITDFPKIHEIIQSEEPDVIEIGSPYLMPWALRRVATRMNIPLIGFFHSNFPNTYARRLARPAGEAVSRWCEDRAWDYARLIYGWCEAVIATSSFAEEQLKEARIGPVFCIPFGIDPLRFDPALRDRSRFQTLGLNPKAKIILYAGRLSPEKNLPALLRALSIVRRQGDFELAVFGSGPLADEIEELSSSLPGLHFGGYADHDRDLPALYASADIFAFPSPNETFGLSPMEALAGGLPVAAVPGGGTEEILNGDVAEIASSPSAEDLAAAILRLAGRLSENLRLRCREHIVSRFTWEATFNKIFDVYHQAIGRRTG